MIDFFVSPTGAIVVVVSTNLDRDRALYFYFTAYQSQLSVVLTCEFLFFSFVQYDLFSLSMRVDITLKAAGLV